MLLVDDVVGELIPDLELPRSVTAYRAKKLAEDDGEEPVTTAQFNAFRRAGLIGSPRDDGTFDGHVVNQLIAIKRAGRYIRPLARRVVFLRGDYLIFPVSAEALRDALIGMLPTVEGAAGKLARVRRWGQSPGSAAIRQAPLPRVKEWKGLLSEAPPQLVEAWAAGWYAMARDVIPAFYAPKPNPLDDIPLEDQVLCLAVLDLTRRRMEMNASSR